MAGMEFSFMDESLFLPTIGDIVLVSNEYDSGAEYLGKLNDLGEITYPNGKISLEKVDNAFQNTLETVFTTKIKKQRKKLKIYHLNQQRYGNQQVRFLSQKFLCQYFQVRTQNMI